MKLINQIKRNLLIIGVILALLILLIWRDINIFLGFVVGLLVTNFNFDLMAKQLYIKPMQRKKTNLWMGFVTRYMLYFVTLYLVYTKFSLHGAFACMVSYFTLRLAIYTTIKKEGGDLDD